jgi:hypothetical protein
MILFGSTSSGGISGWFGPGVTLGASGSGADGVGAVCADGVGLGEPCCAALSPQQRTKKPARGKKPERVREHHIREASLSIVTYLSDLRVGAARNDLDGMLLPKEVTGQQVFPKERAEGKQGAPRPESSFDSTGFRSGLREIFVHLA